MAANLEWRLTGGASNDDPKLSLGGVASSSVLAGTPEAFFDNVNPLEMLNGDEEYRALALYNAGDDLAALVSVLLLADTFSPDTSLAIGIEASPIGSTTTIADESTAPAGVSFSQPVEGSPLPLPDIPAGSACLVWFKRTVSAGAANMRADSVSFAVDYA